MVDHANKLERLSAELKPVIYTHQPEYWEIQVVGCSPGAINMPVMTPYRAILEVTHFRGKKGIVVVGAGGKQVQVENRK